MTTATKKQRELTEAQKTKIAALAGEIKSDMGMLDAKTSEIISLGKQSSAALWRAGKGLLKVKAVYAGIKGGFAAFCDANELKLSTCYQAIQIALKIPSEAKAAEHSITGLKIAVGIVAAKGSKKKKSTSKSSTSPDFVTSLGDVLESLVRIESLDTTAAPTAVVNELLDKAQAIIDKLRAKAQAK